MNQTLAELLGISAKPVDNDVLRLESLELAVSPLVVFENAEIVLNLKNKGFTESEIALRLATSQPLINRYLKIAKRWSDDIKNIVKENSQMFEPMEVWGWSRLQWSDVKTPSRKGRSGRSLVNYLKDRLRLKDTYRRGRGQKVSEKIFSQQKLDHDHELSKLKGRIHELEIALARIATPISKSGDDRYVEERIKNALKMKVSLNSDLERIELNGFGCSPHFKSLVQKIFDLAEESEKLTRSL